MGNESNNENKTETQERNATLKRQEFRLQILKTLCKELNFDITNFLTPDSKIFELFPDENQNIVKEMTYLREKDYLTFQTDRRMGNLIFLRTIKVKAKAIDLIEKIQTNTQTKEYEQDFSQDALMNFSNIYNSQILVNSPTS